MPILFLGVIVDYFKYLSNVKYNEKPDYDLVRRFFSDALRSLGKQDEGKLNFETKTYELEIELDISSDAEININIERTPSAIDK